MGSGGRGSGCKWQRILVATPPLPTSSPDKGSFITRWNFSRPDGTIHKPTNATQNAFFITKTKTVFCLRLSVPAVLFLLACPCLSCLFVPTCLILLFCPYPSILVCLSLHSLRWLSVSCCLSLPFGASICSPGCL